VPRRMADTTRAREELGFTAEMPLAEGLSNLREWYFSSAAREVSV
jgi:nucleoside-diphosphate-sugar epimerase